MRAPPSSLRDGRSKDLGAASRKRVQSHLLQPLEHVPNGESRDFRIIGDLESGKGLQVDGREALFEPPDQVQIVLKGQVGMKPADDVEFRNRFPPVLPGDMESLLERRLTFGGNLLLENLGRACAALSMDFYEKHLAWVLPGRELHCRLLVLK